MSDLFGPVWVVAESNEGKTLEVSLQLIGQARKLAIEIKSPVEVIFLGKVANEQLQLLFNAGADVVYLGDEPEFEHYQPEIFVETIVSIAKEKQPEIMLLGSTFMGRELAPLIAARLETGLTAHCTDLVLNENKVLEQRVPAYGGLISIICPDKRPQMATVARGVFPKPIMEESRSGEVVKLKPPEGITNRVQTLEIVHEEPEGILLESARLIVAGGAGAGSVEGWTEIEELSSILDAGLASTRPAVDEGWIDISTMIGQSGKMVSPEFYIGIGLSGEQQHMVGVIGAKVMVAINSDTKSPVFDQVDYGIVEDCREFVPVLIERLKNWRK